MAENKELKVSISSNLDATGFNQAQSKIKDLSTHADKLSASFKTFAGLAASLGAVTLFKQQITQAIDFADSLSKLSQKTGITADGLYSLSAAAKLSDVDFASLEGSLSKFSKSIGEASMGTGKAKDAFERLGVSIKKQDGTLKDSFSLLTELSDQFKNMPDGAMKATTAMELFGKSGADMIPLLNSGSEALKEFSGIMNNDTAKAAEEFNDSLTKVGLSTNAFFTQIVKDLSPTIQSLTKNFNKLAESVNKYTINMDVAKRSVFDIKTSKDFDAKKELLEKELKELQKLISDDDGWFWFGLDDRTTGQYVARIARIQQQLQQLNGVAEDTFKKQDSYVQNLEDRFSYTISPERQKEIDERLFDIQKTNQDKKLELAKKHSDEIKKLAEDTRKFEDEQFAILAQNSEKSFKQLDAVKDWAKEEEESAKNATNAMKSMQDAMITYYEAIGDTQSAYYEKEAKLVDELKEKKLLTDAQINEITAKNKEKFLKEQFEENNKWLMDLFDNVEKAMDESFFDVTKGKFKSFGDWLKDFFESIGDSILRGLSRTLAGDLTNTIKNSLMGGSGSSFNIGNVIKGMSATSIVGSTVSASEIGSLMNSGATFDSATNTIKTVGGTLLNLGADGSGTVASGGTDAMSLLSTVGTLKTAFDVVSGGVSSMVSGAFGSIANGLGSIGLDSAGTWVSQFGGGFANPFTTSWTPALSGSSTGMGAMAGGTLMGAGLGYGVGSLGDMLFGAETKAGIGGAIGGGLGYLLAPTGPLGMIVGSLLGSMIGGLFGSTKVKDQGLQALYNVTGDASRYDYDASNGNTAMVGTDWIQTYTDKEYKSWFDKDNWTENAAIPESQRKAIEQVFDTYDVLLNRLGVAETTYIKAGKYTGETLFNAIDKSFLEAFTGISQDDARFTDMYDAWVGYAESVDQTVTEAMQSSIGSMISAQREFDIWKSGTGSLDALAKQAQYAKEDFDDLASSLGINGVTVNNYIEEYEKAVKNSLDPNTINSWNSLGGALMSATDAQTTYINALKQTAYDIQSIVNQLSGTSNLSTTNQYVYDKFLTELEKTGTDISQWANYSGDYFISQIQKDPNWLNEIKDWAIDNGKSSILSSITALGNQAVANMTATTSSSGTTSYTPETVQAVQQLFSTLEKIGAILGRNNTLQQDLDNAKLAFDMFFDIDVPQNITDWAELGATLNNNASITAEQIAVWEYLGDTLAAVEDEAKRVADDSYQNILGYFNELNDINTQILELQKEKALIEQGITQEAIDGLEAQKSVMETLRNMAQTMRDRLLDSTSIVGAYQSALASARGDYAIGNYTSDSYSRLGDLSSQYADSLKTSSISEQDYKFGVLKIAGEIEGITDGGRATLETVQSEIERITNALKDIEPSIDSQLNALYEQKNTLISQTDREIATLESLLGTNSPMIQMLQVALTAAKTGSTTGITTGSTLTGTLASVADIYSKYDLNQYQSDTSGYEYWVNQVNSGALAVSELDNAIRNSAEQILGTPLAFADGGIVTSRTNALIGEAGYPEAVIPLRDGKGLKVDMGASFTNLEKRLERSEAIQAKMAKDMAKMARVFEMADDSGAIIVRVA